mgnify:CR=1 FL=1
MFLQIFLLLASVSLVVSLGGLVLKVYLLLLFIMHAGRTAVRCYGRIVTSFVDQVLALDALSCRLRYTYRIFTYWTCDLSVMNVRVMFLVSGVVISVVITGAVMAGYGR